jgi:tRNA (guanine-N7-)-methyltransferase
MGKDKLRRYAELHTYSNVIEPEFVYATQTDHAVKGKWNETYFKNNNKIVLELGCGKGEYTVKLAEKYTDKNFIGVDIKGARLLVGASSAVKNSCKNVMFLRTMVEFLGFFFQKNEAEEIWITFPDPQEKKRRAKKRLTSAYYLNLYKKFLKPGGIVHLKTDNDILYNYTLRLIQKNQLELLISTFDLYNSSYADLTHNITTYFESRFLSQGMPIHYLQFKLNGDVNIEEPEDEDEE